METKLKIIRILDNNRNGVHLRELSRILKTGMPNVKRTVDNLENDGIVKKQKDANLIKISLRNNIKTIACLKQVHTERLNELPVKIRNAILDFIDELEIRPLIALIFGSYAHGTYNKNSDIDILLVFQRIEDAHSIESLAKKISMRTNTKINPAYLDYKNFEANFMNKKHDFSNEIRQDIILIAGLGEYYRLLWRFLY